MKKISYLLTVVLALAVAACDNTPRELTELMPDKPYLFYSAGCPHCHEAQEFLNRKYPELNIIKVSVDNKDGSLYGVVGTFANIIEWISEAEWEKLKEQGY